MKCDIPSVHVDWFIANASLPPLYHDLLSLPLTDRELETRLEVDVAQNLQNAPGVRVWRAGTNDSRVSSHNRVIERHKSRYGAYWKSYDFAGSVGTQNIFNHPLSFTPDGGEAIFNLPKRITGLLRGQCVRGPSGRSTDRDCFQSRSERPDGSERALLFRLSYRGYEADYGPGSPCDRE